MIFDNKYFNVSHKVKTSIQHSVELCTPENRVLSFLGFFCKIFTPCGSPKMGVKQCTKEKKISVNRLATATTGGVRKPPGQISSQTHHTVEHVKIQLPRQYGNTPNFCLDFLAGTKN